MSQYVTQAMNLLASVEGVVSENLQVATGEYKADVLAAAQVHATLAVAEQLRLANLVAMSGSVYDANLSVEKALYERTTGERTVLNPQVAEILQVGSDE